MNDSQHSELLDDPEFQSILATCLEKLEQGESLDRAELVARHPQYASGLREFLDDHELLRRLAREVKSEQAAVTAAIEPTIAGGSSPLGVAIGETIQYVGEYRILGEIARGGMGVVFKAQQRQLKRIVALKMILAGRLANEADVQRFQREAQAAARLQHPNIVPVHEVGEFEGHHYFTMDYVAGLNLAEVIRDEALSATRAAEIVKTLAKATHYAHEQDTLHRDLKPANVILDANDQPHITDFGLAKIATDNKDESGDDLTATGQVLGTPSYMSPEQAEGKQDLLGPATDTYALGAILYACLTGRAPFVADSPVDTLLQVVRNEPASPRLLNPSVPKDLETICLKCLAKEPRRRYGQARLLADDLARFLDGRPVLARPIGRSAMFARWCTRNPVVAALATTAAVLLIVGTVVSSYFAVRANMAADAEHTARLNAQASESRATTLATQMSNLADEKASLAAAESQARQEQQRLKEVAVEGRDHARRSLYLADLRRARQSIRDGELGEAGRILRLHVPGVDEGDQRSWEWYYLLARSEREVSKQSNLASSIQRVRWSPDGRWLATAGNPNRKVIRIYEGAAFRLHKTWLVGAAVSQISWAPDSQHVALSLGNGKVQKWRTADGVMDFEVAGSAADWSHDGSMIACGPTNSKIVIYDAQSGEVKFTTKGTIDSRTFRGLAWNPDNRRIAATSTWSGRVFDVQTGQAVAEIRYPQKGGFSTSRCAWSPDGKELAFGYGYGVFLVCVWNAESGKTRWYDGHFDHVLDVAWNTDGTKLASASNDRRIQIRDSQSGEVLRTLTGHSSQVQQLAWRPGDDLIISVSREPQLGVWSLDARPLPSRKFGGSGVEVASLSWDSTRDRLVSSEPGATRIWDTAEGKELRAIERHSDGVDVAAWRPHSDWIATSAKVSGSSLEHLQIWSADSRDHILSLPTARRIWGVDWSPDGKYVVGVGAHHEVSVHDAESGELVWRIPLVHNGGGAGYMVGVSWSPDGTRLALCKERQPSSVWSFESRTKLCDLEYSGNGWAIVWSPDSSRIARATKSATIDILDALTGKLSMRLQGHRGWVRSVDWSPDGRRLASASNDRSVRVWDAQTGEEILILRGHEAPACAVAWRPNNEQLASGDEQGVIRIWDARQGYASARGRVIPWWVVGMYPADVEASFPPERAIDPTAGVTHPDGAARNWSRVTTTFDGEIDFNMVSAVTRDRHSHKLPNRRSQQARPGDRSAYAQSFVYSTRDQSVNVWLGHDAGARLWLNDQEIYRYQAGNRNYADASHLTVGLKAGWNRLLARVWDGPRAFALYLRLTGADGQRNLEGVQFSHYPGAETLPEIGAPAPFREESPSADREMAELALRLGAPVEIDGHVVSSPRDLGEDEFFVTAMDWSGHPAAAAFVLPRLSTLTHLRTLTLRNANDSLAGWLANIHSLQRLSLAEGEVSDSAIPKLLQLANLKSLDLTGTLVTASGVQTLRQAAPELDIAWNAYEQDRAAAIWVRELGGVLEIAPGASSASDDELPAYPFRVTKIELNGNAKLTGDDFRRLEHLTALEYLRLDDVGLTDEGMKYLRNLTELQTLSFAKSEMRGEGLRYLSSLTKLKYLRAPMNKLTADGLSHLPALPSVESVSFDLMPPITDAALKHFQRLPNLKSLSFWNGRLTGEGLQYLAPLKHLERMTLQYHDLRDETLDQLRKLPALKRLTIRRNKTLTDDGFRRLAVLKNLEYLKLDNVKLSKSAAEYLRAALPDCNFVWKNDAPATKERSASEKAEDELLQVSQAIEGDRENLKLLRRRIELLEQWQRWPEALADVQRYLKLSPGDGWRPVRGLLLARLVRDEEQTRTFAEACLEIVSRDSSDPHGKAHAALALLMAPQQVADFQPLLAAARASAKDQTAWYRQLPLLLALLRAEQFEELRIAIGPYLDSESQPPRAVALLIETLRLHHAAQPAAARDMYRRASETVKMLPRGQYVRYVNDLMVALLLYREAQAIFDHEQGTKTKQAATHAIPAPREAPPANTADIEHDLKALDGDWTIEQGVEDGANLPARRLKKAYLRFAGGRLVYYMPPPPDAVDLGPKTQLFEIDPTKTPKTIDVFSKRGERSEERGLGIYELKDDQLKVVFSDPVGSPRPGQFAGKSPDEDAGQRSTWIFLTLERKLDGGKKSE